MTEHDRQIVFELLQASLWQRSVDTAVLGGEKMSESQWTPILQFLYDHSLLVLVANTIHSLPPYLQPSERQKSELQRLCDLTALTHHNMNKTVVDVMMLLHSNNHKAILLKGQGLAAIYPVADSRACGDIDIYIGSDGYEDACHIVEDYCGVPQTEIKREASCLHHSTSKGRIKLEIHHLAADTAIKSIKKDYNEWAERKMLQSNETVYIKGKQIAIPEGLTNIVYVFEHLLKHLRGEGVGLRQFVDWMLLLRQYNDTIGKAELKETLVRFKLMDAWQVLGGILVWQLGYPEEKFPFWDTRKAKHSQGHNLNYILQANDLGKGISAYKGYYYMPDSFKRNVRAFFYSVRRFLFMYKIFPSDAIQVYFKEIKKKVFTFR